MYLKFFFLAFNAMSTALDVFSSSPIDEYIAQNLEARKIN